MRIINHRKIKDNTFVKKIITGDTARIVNNSFHNDKPRMIRIDKDHGVNPETGELIVFNHSVNRRERMADFRRSLSALRDLILTNVVDLPRCFFVTITYDENISDKKRLQKDFPNFIKKVRRKYGRCEYIQVVEFQGRGALHCHVILIFDEVPSISIGDEQIRKCWALGSVNSGPITSAEATAKYLTNYLFEYQLYREKWDDYCKSKKQKKGERVPFYESGSHLYNPSRGIRRPIVVKGITYAEAKESLGDAECIDAKTLVYDNCNVVTIENYRIKEGSDAADQNHSRCG